jgi:hypothetical protein
MILFLATINYLQLLPNSSSTVILIFDNVQINNETKDPKRHTDVKETADFLRKFTVSESSDPYPDEKV